MIGFLCVVSVLFPLTLIYFRVTQRKKNTYLKEHFLSDVKVHHSSAINSKKIGNQMKGSLIIKIKQRRMYYEFDFLYIYFFLTYKALLITKDDKSTSLKMSKVQHISFVYRQLNAPIDGFSLS
mmetsp:Transcript_6870/g.10187  ORF Transcript_6870/g.10187 Transcript_6870/m.10187 type:complete len:123 (-) Transcript_6870:71-439(-)